MKIMFVKVGWFKEIESGISNIGIYDAFFKGFLCEPFLKYWICYNIASVLCFGFLAARHVGS